MHGRPVSVETYAVGAHPWPMREEKDVKPCKRVGLLGERETQLLLVQLN